MILLNVITKDEKVLDTIIQQVLEHKFSKSVQLDHEVNFYLHGSEIREIKTPKVSFITKALLYKEIEELLFDIAGSHNITIYSIPIGQMNEAYANEIRNYLKAV